MARYRILGPVEAWIDDELVVRPASDQQRLLLSILIVEAGRTVSADRLAEAIWGDDVPSGMAAAVRTQVSRLRRALGPAAADVVTEDRAYRLAVSADEVDAACFERLLAAAHDAEGIEAIKAFEAALALWRGRVLGEVADRGFAQAEAIRLEELRLHAEERRAELLLETGRPGDVVVALQALLARHPERERMRSLLMEALYWAGRHSDALGVYQEWRRHLADELGLEPSPALRRLEREILAHTLPTPTVGTPLGASSLPRPVTSFIGRDDDLSALTHRLDDARLVTLWGMGGVGKTRLALELAATVASRYRDGVRYCDFSTIRRSGGVARALATAISLEERTGPALDEQVVANLASSRLLLVLDSCEHLVPAAARLIEKILRETSAVDVVVTSRVRLLIDGEHAWPVSPLLCTGLDSPAVRLFVDRAHAADPSFRPSGSELDSIQRLCAALDGLPLAVELAAARMTGMSVADMVANLNQRFRLLDRGNGSGRHRSLAALVDWSYKLLAPSDQQVFRRLSVFAGSFGLDAARGVAAGDGIADGEAVAAVLRLVDCSMVSVHRATGHTTYSLLETLREYGSALLHEHGELDTQRDRHARWALDLVACAASGLATDAEASWSTLLDVHFDELRAAHEWLVGSDTAGSLELVAGLHWYALWRLHAELWRWAEVAAAAARAAPAPLLDAVLAMAAFGAAYRGDFDTARRFADSALDATTEPASLGTRRAWAASGEVALLSGRLDDAVTNYREVSQRAVAAKDFLDTVWSQGSVCVGLAYGGRTQDALDEAGVLRDAAGAGGSPSARAFVHWVLAEITMANDNQSAETHLSRSLQLADHAGARLVSALARLTLATMYSRHREPTEALAYYQRAIADWQQAGAWTSQWVTLRTLVDLLARIGAPRDAAVLYAAVMATRTGAPPFGEDAALLTKVNEHLRDTLGEVALGAAIEEGSAMHDDAVIAFAIQAIERTQRSLMLGSACATSISE